MSYGPKVTIAIPVFNGSNYLERAIDSAIGQTYCNVEVIVVNDGSTDNGATEEIARRYEDRIVYVEQTNKGVGGAMNTAISRMTGDFFTWLSHDDVHLPGKVEAQVRYFERLKKNDAVLFSNYSIIDENDTILQTSPYKLDQFLNVPGLPLVGGYINGCTLFIPTHILSEFGGFDESLRFTQDYDLWNKILGKYDFFFQPDVLVHYRVHSGQDTHKPGAIDEGNALWTRMLEERSEVERVQLFGSTKRFFRSRAEFLEQMPYKTAALCARRREQTATREALVSVVIPFRNSAGRVVRAAQSVLEQTHAKIEVILVDDGSEADLAAVQQLAHADRRVRLVRQAHAGPGAARNAGILRASGDYIAFLDTDGLFVPHKIQHQLEAMQDVGSVFSHTSYYVAFPERTPIVRAMPTGRATGNLYPAIIGHCPISTPTVMLHRSLVGAGLRFATEPNWGQDALTWIWAAQRYSLLGIDEPLSVVEWSADSAAIDLGKAISGTSFVYRSLVGDFIHSRYRDQLVELEGALRNLTSEAAAFPIAKGSPLNEKLIASVFDGESL